MNILLVNKFYYPRGGDCTATLALEELLLRKGHNVAIFSSVHKENLPSVWSDYFPSEINFADPSLKGKAKAAMRLFYSQEVKTKLYALIEHFKPDVVHVHNIHSYLSPYVVEIAARKGIKVVWTLHDYKLICPSYNCIRDKKPCTDCYTDKLNVVRKRCMKNSLLASLLAYVEALVWNKSVLERYTNAFISPSFFLREQMKAGRFLAKKINVLHNFIYKKMPPPSLNKEDYYCYLGRISEEKGIDVLLSKAAVLPYKIKLIGGGEDLERYKQKYASENIEFHGYMPTEDAWEILRKAKFSIVPSIWYENNPFSIIESLCLGTPVLGADIGGIPELIDEGINGLIFESGNEKQLGQKIKEMYSNNFDYLSIAETAKEKFSSENYYNKLISIYKQ